MPPETTCTKCGTRSPVGSMKCRICGHPIHDTKEDMDSFHDCGARVDFSRGEKCIACGSCRYSGQEA